MSARWTLFCAMIDNYGDIGVCWRLARQLRQEYGIQVDLWVDDWAAAGRFLAAQQPALAWPQADDSICVCGINVMRWQQPWPDSTSLTQRIASSDCLIEAFGCELPDAVKHTLAQRQTPLLWINLEYLSAEQWVAGCHGLPSPQRVSPQLKKYFFFPGFQPDTGGLLRETGLLECHARWQSAPLCDRRQQLSQLFSQIGMSSGAGNQAAKPASCSLVVSVFCYETPAFHSWLTALQEGPDTVLCLIPEGRSVGALAGFPGLTTDLPPGSVHQRGKLTVQVLPFMSQDNYDQLLSLCDFNLVRGEDSFVRAQWAGKPFMWHIYPQDDGVHITKLQAFADAYLSGLNADAAEAWLSFARCWNLGEDCREMWHYLRPQLPDLLLHTQEWQKKLAVMPDLATNLVKFETFTKLSVSP